MKAGFLILVTKLNSFIHLLTSAKTSSFDSEGYISLMSKLTNFSFSFSFLFLILTTNPFESLTIFFLDIFNYRSPLDSFIHCRILHINYNTNLYRFFFNNTLAGCVTGACSLIKPPSLIF